MRLIPCKAYRVLLYAKFDAFGHDDDDGAGMRQCKCFCVLSGKVEKSEAVDFAFPQRLTTSSLQIHTTFSMRLKTSQVQIHSFIV